MSVRPDHQEQPQHVLQRRAGGARCAARPAPAPADRHRARHRRTRSGAAAAAVARQRRRPQHRRPQHRRPAARRAGATRTPWPGCSIGTPATTATSRRRQRVLARPSLPTRRPSITTATDDQPRRTASRRADGRTKATATSTSAEMTRWRSAGSKRLSQRKRHSAARAGGTRAAPRADAPRRSRAS